MKFREGDIITYNEKDIFIKKVVKVNKIHYIVKDIDGDEQRFSKSYIDDFYILKERKKQKIKRIT